MNTLSMQQTLKVFIFNDDTVQIFKCLFENTTKKIIKIILLENKT
ncbi:hypothetical protein [uncultured Gammaproteobacteria bacterium]|jgi:hypothetical protein|nr:hypothetical protein [uncultured Gammaproteobacteria bacterium]CAC9600863.1 hypothetical protein [uncultured Gammaproteobacteria bacterium]CAC9614166.1 hypothetical protein [uncultured Gammaproteobacteria bacterium]CAC9615777.1 hypothetical protein [uncultured Gammaproteobacteria bacterium]SMN14148.1 hypothetical protein BHECKSOX2_1503 [Bathymodiolus heckerae thiotrophic gill symbiont]